MSTLVPAGTGAGVDLAVIERLAIVTPRPKSVSVGVAPAAITTA